MYPKLRPVAFQPVQYQGQPLWLIDDPLRLGKRQLMLPYYLARMVSACDGTLDVAQLHQLLCADAGEFVARAVVDDTLRQLDELYLLENARSQQAVAQARERYRAQPFRPPQFAGHSYPDRPDELARFLDAYSADDAALAQWDGWQGRAIVAPHIDYQRGGPVYARVWQRARRAIEAADLIIIWGTDHRAGAAALTLSSLPYATPYGILPTDSALVEALAQVLGPAHAYAHELNHINEHSIELAAVWLHHVRRECCPVLPILVGSFDHFTPHAHPSRDARLTRFMQVLRAQTRGRNVFSIASVDLAHIGPAFDSDYLVDAARRATLAAQDRALMDSVAQGDRDGFYRQLAADRNANNVCGFAPTYLLLDYLGATQGQTVAYDQCPADADNTSVVSICGMLLS